MQLRPRLNSLTPLRNLFQTKPNPWVTELLASGPLESITFDLQHGMIEYNHLLGLLQAARTRNLIPLARLPWNRPEAIMKALDYGIEGLICPMIDTAADAAAFVRAAKYPPLGNRSFGPFRAAILTDEDYFVTANRETLCFAMIETAGAATNLEAIATTPGLDGLYVGPFDLSVSLGFPKRADFSDPQLLDILDQVQEVCRQHDLFSGVFTVRQEDAAAMVDRGFDLVTCGTEDMVIRQALAGWTAGW